MTALDPQAQSYEQLPYESNPFFESHPRRLQTIAYLAGLNPPALENCRVLELGCAGGGNLIPAAESLPNATFIGVDLAPNQIADGQEIIDALGLTNIRLHALSVTDISADFGPFDYIIAHGIYAWVPPEVQHRILEICKAHLSPNGVAYISYNTYPGWRLREVMRELLLYGQADLPSNTPLRKRLSRSREFAEMMLDTAGEDDTAYHRVLNNEIEIVLKSPDSYIAHEHLEQSHAPLYFRDFTARASEQGLIYLCDARPGKAVHQIELRLREQQPAITADPIHFQQCVDFAVGRQFRRSLLIHAGQTHASELDPTRLTRCHFTAGVFPTSQNELHRVGEAEFQAHGGGTFKTSDAVLKTAINAIATVYPEAIRFDCVWEQACRELERPTHDTTARLQLAQNLGSMFMADLLEPHLTPPALVSRVSPKPLATSLARWQAAHGDVIHNRRHRSVRSLNDFERSILTLLDGTRDRPTLENRTGATEYAVRECLQKLAMNAVLIG